MKFYYNDKLIRTSKTHHYTHAIINIANNNKCWMCSATREGCEREKARYINDSLRGIENAKAAISALNAGKKGFYETFGRSTYFRKFGEIEGDTTVEYYEDWIARCKEHIAWYEKNLVVVEIEERN